MVLQKRSQYGFHGYQIPTMPTGCRSARKKRAIRYAVDPAKLCAIDLLATVAGELLLEKEEDVVATVVTPPQPDDKRPAVKVEPCNRGNDGVAAPAIQCPKKLSHKHMFKEANSQASSLPAAFLEAAAQAGGDAKSSGPIIAHSPALGASASPKLEKEEMAAAAAATASVPVWIGSNPSKNNTSIRVPGDQGNRTNKAAPGRDQMDVDTKPPAPPLASSDSSVEVPATYSNPRNFMPRNSSVPRFQDKSVMDHDANGDTDEDDGNSSACTHPSTVSPRAATASSAFRPQRIGDRRIRKLLSSRFWKLGPAALKEGDFCDRDMFRSKKLSYTRHNSQRSSFKRRKLFERSSISSSSGGIAKDTTISKLSSDYNNKSIKGEQGNETSSSITSPKPSFKSEGYQVKLKIKSFKVPELFIEMPETATVGSLKRAVLETVTAMLGNGLKVGVIYQGRKVRDDSRTLVQAGITGGEKLDSLNFSLEPAASSSSSALLQTPHGSSSCRTETLPLEQCRSPRPLALRLPALAEFQADTPDGTAKSESRDQQPQPKVLGLASPVGSDKISKTLAAAASGTAICHADDAAGAIVPVSSSSLTKAIVPVNPSPPSSSDLALAVVPASNKMTRRPETGQRRIRRPFSVAEVEALVQAVEKLGTGRWRDVKLQAFENAKHRTYVDLKDKWKTLVHTARISPQQRRGEPVPQDLLDRVLVAHAHWSQHQARLQSSKHVGNASVSGSGTAHQQQPSCLAAGLLLPPPPPMLQTEQQPHPVALQPLPAAALI